MFSGLYDRVRSRVRTVGGQAPTNNDFGGFEDWSGVVDNHAPLTVSDSLVSLDLAVSQ